ncbi:ADP compounds hydrolase NudE [Candidatus Nitrosacidococcus tergens]|uniref:ADP compounds hydrolase NudE n=1 Tax=Candidatus Nitrosacidococcus tergens TaxID=553981 RepID=A0A7G1Q7S0_9GAMM|nr:ADP compounds hydrolase NudE [Candidatus Nitrosacidococcus tergens]CAB1274706.1 ADP compounds hydrolase NudE [Candidatus Nitrosacidococcus tergens]
MVNTNRSKPKIITTKTIAKTRFFHVEHVNLHFSNGVNTHYERLKSDTRGAVLIVPMLDQETVLLVREYAVGTERYELALPKGHVEAEEDLLAAANREIMEEVSYGAHRLTYLTSFTLAPSYMSHHIHVVLAEDLYEEHRDGDEPEEIEVVPWKLSKLTDLIARQDCTEARSIAALFMIKERFNR